MNAGELDGVIIAEAGNSPFTKHVLHTCKFYGIPKVGIADLFSPNPFNVLFMLDAEKTYLGYLETNIIDGCNLNCKGCTHFAGLFKHEEIYPLEDFKRDVRQLSRVCDVRKFHLLGGEPLLLKNINEYVKISRQYLRGTDLRIVTNGLLIPSMPESFFATLRENNCTVDISAYAPTMKISDKIKQILTANKIVFHLNNYAIEKFGVLLTLNGNNNPNKARNLCCNDTCRLLRNGKIYKCPFDALSYRFAEKFGLENLPAATGVDLYASNFASLIQMLDGNVEMCSWCSDQSTRRTIPWEPTNNPKLEDWLANPDEIKTLQ